MTSDEISIFAEQNEFSRTRIRDEKANPATFLEMLRKADVSRVDAVYSALEERHIPSYFVGSVLERDRSYNDIDIVGLVNVGIWDTRKFLINMNRAHEESEKICLKDKYFRVNKEESENHYVLGRFTLIPQCSLTERIPLAQKPANIDLILIEPPSPHIFDIPSDLLYTPLYPLS